MKLGPPPTLAAAFDEIDRVGVLVGGATARVWARELHEIAAKLSERSPRGPRGSTWSGEAMRLKLACTVAERAHRRRAAFDGAKALAGQLPILEGMAVNPADAREVETLKRELISAVADEVEQMRLRTRAGALDGKAMADKSGPWGSEKSRAFARFIHRIGGYSADGLPPVGPLDYDAAHAERATQLILGEAEPESPAERQALATWRRKYPAVSSAA